MANRNSVLWTVIIVVVIVVALGYLAMRNGWSLLGSTASNRIGACCITRYSDTTSSNVCMPTLISQARCSQTLKGKWFASKGACDKFVLEQPSAEPCSK